MIPKANQRAGGRQLATHLLNEFDNDRVEVGDLRGAVADHLHGAFHEWAATARITSCKKYLYSLSVNPDPEQRPVTREEYYDYIARVEKALGLTGQPRAVIFHVKYGREHCHVVWSRIDAERKRAVQLSYDRQTLRTVTQDFARDHGLQLPPGMRRNGLKDRFNNRSKLENLAEKQQEERTGISKAERMAAITAAWRESDNAKSFAAALEQRGYFLARGDKRAFVVVDMHGEIHALARQIEGVRTKQVKARLAGVLLERLPDARKAQEFARQQLQKQRASKPEIGKTTAAGMTDDLAKAQKERRTNLDQKRQELFARHRAEREALAIAQQSQEKGILSARLRAQPKGVIAFIARITGIRLLVAHRQKKQDKARAGEHKTQREALKRRHERETLDFQHRYRGLVAVEKRERHSLVTAVRREQFRMIAGLRAAPERPLAQRTPSQAALTPEQRARLEAMRQAGLSMTTPAQSKKRSPGSRVASAFNKAAAGQDTDSVRETETRKPKADVLEEMKRAGEEITAPTEPEQEKSKGLGGKFNEAAKGRTRDDRRRRQRRFSSPLTDHLRR